MGKIDQDEYKLYGQNMDKENPVIQHNLIIETVSYHSYISQKMSAKQNFKGTILIFLVSCLLVQVTFAGWDLLIKSDGQGQTLDGGRAFTVSADRFKDFNYPGVLGVWKRKPSDARDDEKATLIEKFTTSCGKSLRLSVMGDDEFKAYINGVRVLDGNDWDEIETQTFNIQSSKFNIQCGVANELKIQGQNDKQDASIAYTLQEQTSCRNCQSGFQFSSALCRCAQAPNIQTAIDSRLQWNVLENPIQIYDHEIDFTNKQNTRLSQVQFPVGANPKQLLITATATYVRNPVDNERNMIKFYQDYNNAVADDDVLEHVMMIYRREGAISTTNFNYETQQNFALPLAENKNLKVQPLRSISGDSKLYLDIIGWR